MERGMYSLLRLVCLVVLTARVFGAQADPKAASILEKLSAQLTGARTAEVSLHLAVKATNNPAGEGDLAADYLLSIERPNKMALVLKDGNLGATVVCDGTNTTTFVPQPKIYTIRKAPNRIGGAEGGASTGDLGSMAFITALFSDNPQTALLAGVLEAKFGGAEKIGDAECDRIDMKQEGLGWRLFTTAGAKPLVRRIEVTIPQLNMSMDFSGWKLNAAIPAERFKFTPPDGARKVDKLLEDEEKEEGQDSDLIGEELPRLKLKTLDGDTLDTASFKGHTTILIVWAGEAAHCASAIEAAVELAASHKGVAIYGIDIDEKPDKARIKDFLGKNKAALKTAIDQNRQVVDSLGLEGVPITFLIDKVGVIRNAFLGYHNDFKSLVGKELDALR